MQKQVNTLNEEGLVAATGQTVSAGTSDNTAMRSFLRELPKAELHLHLEGSLELQTVLELAARHNRLDTLPATTIEGLRRWAAFTDFQHFRQVTRTLKELLRTPDDFALVVYDCGRDMAAQNIWYREVTLTPYSHTHYLEKGLTIEDILHGLEAGRQRAAQDFGVEMRWIFDIPRNRSFPDGDGRRYHAEPADYTLEYAIAGRSMGVVGLGLGGDEVNAPPQPFTHAFAAAKDAGLLSLPHAGELAGPASIWGALEELRADRIGHGVRAIEDPMLVATLRERQTPLEISVGSNVCLGVFRLDDHPLPELVRQGVVVTVNSDDPPLFNTSLCQEYELLVDSFGYNQTELVRLARTAFEVCGADEATKTALLERFDRWADTLGVVSSR